MLIIKVYLVASVSFNYEHLFVKNKKTMTFFMVLKIIINMCESAKLDYADRTVVTGTILSNKSVNVSTNVFAYITLKAQNKVLAVKFNFLNAIA